MKKMKNTLFETPSQTAGPFLHIGCTPNLIGIKSIFNEDIACRPFEAVKSEELIKISGKVFDGSNNPVLDVMIETWQCNQNGMFDRTKGFSRITSNLNTGTFDLRTVKPGYTKDFNGKLQSPHILFFIVARGMNQPLITRMYFEEKELEKDYLYKVVKDKNRINTLLAKKNNDKEYIFDIYLQGNNETIFFDF